MFAFVLLWASAAIFSRWALDHGSAFAVLIIRFSLAFGATLLIGLAGRGVLPRPQVRGRVAGIGLLMIGGYSIFYFQAMSHGVTPGLLATILGVQPVLTLALTERQFSPWRLLGLLLALVGLVLVVYQSLILARLSGLGIALGICALACVTFGTMFQKRIQLGPSEVLPLQYFVALVLCLGFVPFQPFDFELSADFLIPVFWLGLAISVGSQFLLYRMIRSGNLVNVTSLLYLVPLVTVVLDYLILGNAMPLLAMVGMVAILAGLVLAFKAHAA